MCARARACVQECCCRGAPLLDVLRLAVLLCAAQGGAGLPRRVLDGLRSEVLATYGHAHLASLNTLERAGAVPCGCGWAWHGMACTVAELVHVHVHCIHTCL